MINEAQAAAMRDIWSRRITAFSENSGSDYRKVVLPAIAEATTREDIDTLNGILRSLPDEVQNFVTLYEEVWGEFGKFRCSVCGRTSAQSEAIGYDCITGC